jgi:hypothetical protein
MDCLEKNRCGPPGVPLSGVGLGNPPGPLETFPPCRAPSTTRRQDAIDVFSQHRVAVLQQYVRMRICPISVDHAFAVTSPHRPS